MFTRSCRSSLVVGFHWSVSVSWKHKCSRDIRSLWENMRVTLVVASVACLMFAKLLKFIEVHWSSARAYSVRAYSVQAWLPFVVVVGAGASGLSAARALRSAGAKVACVYIYIYIYIYIHIIYIYIYVYIYIYAELQRWEWVWGCPVRFQLSFSGALYAQKRLTRCTRGCEIRHCPCFVWN